MLIPACGHPEPDCAERDDDAGRSHYISGDISPDDSQVILFLNNPDIQPPAPGALWVIGLDGTGLRQVTPAGTQVQCYMNYRWSSDGTKILFASADGGLWTISRRRSA